MPSARRAPVTPSRVLRATTAIMPMPRFQVPSDLRGDPGPDRPAPGTPAAGSRSSGRARPTTPRQHAREVRRDAAAGHVAERVHRARSARRAAAGAVRCRAGSARAAPRPRRRRSRPSESGMPTPRLARMWRTSEKPLLCSPDEAIATTTSPCCTRSGPSTRIRLDRTDRGAGDVVVVRAEQTRVLGGLAADERGAGLEHSRARCRRRCRRCARARPCRRRCSRS